MQTMKVNLGTEKIPEPVIIKNISSTFYFAKPE